MASVIGRDGRTPNQAYEQPGLEAVPQEQLRHSEGWSGLEVSNQPQYYDAGKEAVHYGHDTDKIPAIVNYGDPEQPSPPERRRKRLWFILGGIALALIIIGAVVGGVLGSRASQADEPKPTEESTPESTPSPTPSANTTKSQSLRQGSSLTVAGWQNSGGAELFLFYQDYEHQIWRSRCDASGLSSNQSSSWETPTKFNSFASEGSRLGATIIQYATGYLPQVELFYTNDDNRLLGLSMNDQYSPEYGEDSIKDKQLRSGDNSSVAAYWPWAIYQGSDGVLVEVRNLLGGAFAPAAQWDAKKLGVKAAGASELALVPLSANFSKIAIQGGYGIFYQAEDDKLVALIPDLGSEELATDYATSWPTDFPSITLPKNGSFAAFSVARPSDSLQRVNTYVLYLDSSSNINVVYSDSSSWQTSQPSVLKDVDADTNIACLTMTTTYRDSTRAEVLLEDASAVEPSGAGFEGDSTLCLALQHHKEDDNPKGRA
ncbi:hypothetical protein EsH8_I_000346 [Colletotrichum jinshuiense]